MSTVATAALVTLIGEATGGQFLNSPRLLKTLVRQDQGPRLVTGSAISSFRCAQFGTDRASAAAQTGWLRWLRYAKKVAGILLVQALDRKSTTKLDSILYEHNLLTFQRQVSTTEVGDAKK